MNICFSIKHRCVTHCNNCAAIELLLKRRSVPVAG